MAAPVNSSRHYARVFAERAAARGHGSSFRVLDAGAGSAPYADVFAHVAYETADLAATPGKDYSHIDHVCDLVDIPVENDRFDLVWCSQVLEHCREPRRVLAEFARVLRPGGEAWLTAPFFYEEHEKPWDFYRFSRFGWQHLAAETGFEVVEIEPMEGYYGTLAYSLGMAAKHLPKEMADRRALMAELAAEFAELDLVDKRTDIGMCKNYQVVLRLPAS
ncbi:class I SAM-dependent methyltransferase [Janibacter sp. G1551]|uniref:class I SAM-dependent methyltransferase n=1 Tax=Janibacter sp. G1551 TaxID=3420440 RepID=UPI003D09361F